MARLDYRRKKMITIYAVALLLMLCCVSFTACNANSGVFDVSGEEVSEPTHFIAKLMLQLNESIGVFGWTVVAFTVILKLILSPLDIWQKAISRRNAKAMERMRPQLEALAEKCGDDKQRYQQEQMALYKKEKYSMLGACLPSLITLVVFFVLFAGFRQMVGYQLALDYKESYNAFITTYEEYMIENYGEDYAEAEKTLELAEVNEAAISAGQDAVYQSYFSEENQNRRSFLWIHNIFVSDSWVEGVPDYLVVTGQEGLATSKITGVTKDEYDLVMAKVLASDEMGYGNGNKWNGLLILPLLTIALSFISQRFITKSQGAPPPTAGGQGAAGQSNMKMMQFLLPIFVGIFALFYSAAFALYTFTSSFVSVVFQLVFILVGKLLDKRAEKKSSGFARVK